MLDQCQVSVGLVLGQCQVSVRLVLGQCQVSVRLVLGQLSDRLEIGQLSVRLVGQGQVRDRLGLGLGQDQGQLRVKVRVRLQVYLLLIFTSFQFLPSLLLLPSWRQIENRHCLHINGMKPFLKLTFQNRIPLHSNNKSCTTKHSNFEFNLMPT